MEQNSNKILGLFTYLPDKQTSQLASQLEKLEPGCSQIFNLSLPGNESVWTGADSIVWDGVIIDQLKLAYIHGFSYQFPLVPQQLKNTDWSIWQTSHVRDQQQFSFVVSLFKELTRRGVTVVNPVQSHITAFMKYEQLQTLRRAGFSLPKMVYTNDMDVAIDFCQSHDNPLWRPGTGRATWQLFQDRQRNHLIATDKPPVLIAEMKQGPLIRGFFFHGKPLLFLQNRAPGLYPLESLETIYQADYSPVYDTLPSLNSELDTSFIQASFVLQDDTAWIYDIDVDPVFDWMPAEYYTILNRSLALCLLERQEDVDNLHMPHEAKERPTLFVRRMLKILFDMEASKYRP